MRYFFLLILILSSCVTDSNISSPSATLEPISDDWETIADGMQYQLIRENAVFFEAIRIDPQKYNFRSHYRPQAPLTLEQWTNELPDAISIVNSNFFTPDNEVLGLLISDGQLFGASYRNRGGTFYATNAMVGILRNAPTPSLPADTAQAIQAFPMLLVDGQVAYTNVSDTAISRRTVIALDESGFVVLLVTSGFGMSLPTLSQFLADSELQLVTALNLDGGGSTMMRLSLNDTSVVSLDPVPSVLAVYPRNEE